MDSKLREIRVSQGISLDRLSANTGLAKSSLSMLERELAEPLLSTARRIAAALDVDEADIWPESDHG